MALIEDVERDLNLPPCYRFDPTDNELITIYLKNKVIGKPLPADIIPTVDVYSNSPDQLPLYNSRYRKENEWYFFTTRPNGNLLTSDGYYVPCMEEIIIDGNEVIGFVKTLVFRRGRLPGGRETCWIIHEFRVNPNIIDATELDDGTPENFVLIKVVRLQEAEVNEHQSSTEETNVRLQEAVVDEHQSSTEERKENAKEKGKSVYLEKFYVTT